MIPKQCTQFIVILAGFAMAGGSLSPLAFGQATPPESASAQEQHIVKMDPFTVSESSNVGYGARSTSSSGRLVQEYVDVPQTVHVLTSEFMSDWHLTDSRLALEYVPGLFPGSSINPGQYFLRGSQVSATYIDGMLQMAYSTGNTDFGSYNQPTEFFDRIEVVKGPSSAAFGLGEAGGIINYVSKMPQGVNRTDVSAGIGDNQNYRAAVDTQGVQGKLSYRVQLLRSDGHNYIEGMRYIQSGAQLALKYQIAPRTTLNLIASYADTVQPGLAEAPPPYTSHTGALVGGGGLGLLPIPGYTVTGTLPLPRLVPKSNSTLPSGFNQDNIKSLRVNLILNHSFNDNISLRNALFYGHVYQEQNVPLPSDVVQNPSPGVYTDPVILLIDPNWSHQFRDSLDLLADYYTSYGHYRTLIGGEYYDAHLAEDTWLGFLKNLPDGSGYAVDIYNPSATPGINQFIDPSSGFYLGRFSDTTTGYGFYAQEEASFWRDRLTLMAGWRIDYRNFTNITYGSPNTITSPGWENTKGAPRFAVTVKPEKWVSFYGLYTVHKDPAQSTKHYNIVGEPLPPSTVSNPNELLYYNPSGTTIEAGIKANLWEEKISASVAVWHAIDKGTVIYTDNKTYNNPDGTVTGYSRAVISGKNVHGIELEATGRATDRLTFTASYALCKGTSPLSSGLINQVGLPTSYGFHGKYDFGNLRGDGLYATFGVIAFAPYWYAQNFATREINNRTGQAGDIVSIFWNTTQYTADAGIGYRWNHGRQSIYASVTNFTNNLVEFGTFVGNTSQLPLRQAWLVYSHSFR